MTAYILNLFCFLLYGVLSGPVLNFDMFSPQWWTVMLLLLGVNITSRTIGNQDE